MTTLGTTPDGSSSTWAGSTEPEETAEISLRPVDPFGPRLDDAIPPADLAAGSGLGDGTEILEPGPTSRGRRSRWRRRFVIALFGLVMVAAVVGAVLSWQATGKEEYPPLAAGWALMVPLAVVATVLAIRRGPLGDRRRLRLASAGVAVIVVSGLAIATHGVDPCDKRGPGVSLRGCQLSGRDIRGKNLAGANLTRANLSKARLQGANLRGAVLTGARLPKADLRKANLAGAKLDDAVLDGADLSGADLHNASITAASLDKAVLVGAELNASDLSRAKLPDADLRDARGPNVNLSGAALPRAVLDGASMQAANLAGADLSAASLTKTNLANVKGGTVNLSGAVLNGTDLREASLTATNLTTARLTDVNLTRADLTGSAMRGVQMDRVALDSTKLASTTDLEDAALASALSVEPRKVSRALSLRGAQFEPADQVVAKVGAACGGSGVQGTRAYNDSPEFHAGVVLNGAGKVSEAGPLRQLRAVARDGKWAPAGLRYAELVACVDDQSSQLVQDCGTYTARATGDVRNFIRMQLTRHIRVVSTATGQVVAENTFRGSIPRPCTSVETAPSGSEPYRILGDEPSADEMTGWLTSIVRPAGV